MSPKEVEDRADLSDSENKDEDYIRRLLHNIKHGSYSDLNPESSIYSQIRPYPAYYGVHVNESYNRGLSSTSHQLDLWINSAGSAFRKDPLTLGLDDLHYFGVGLPGRNTDALGIPSPFKSSCGAALQHGDVKATLDGENIYRAHEQFIHCQSRRCPKCLRYNTYVDADDIAQRIWAMRSNECRRGASAGLYRVVLSPPPIHKDPLAVARWTSKEGFDDLKKTAVLLLKELGTLGGALIVHHFREDGQDGIENADKTNNTGNPESWRLGLHFHAIAAFDGLVPVEKTRILYDLYGWTIKVIDVKEKGFKEARIRSLSDLKKNLFYLLSHASVMIPDDGGRAIKAVSYFSGATHQKLREIYGPSRRPLYIEGYIEVDDEGRVLYWYYDWLRFAPQDIVELAQVERVNSARVYVDAADYAECSRVIADLRRDLNLSKGEDIPPAALYKAISGDYRFISCFEYKAASPELMRLPKKEQVDGRDLWIFRGDPSADLPEISKEYAAYCQLADEAEAEFIAEKLRSFEAHKGGIE